MGTISIVIFEKYASSQSFDFQLGADCHRDMVARHNNPDRPVEAQRSVVPGSWRALLVLTSVLRALLGRWAGAARKHYQTSVVGTDVVGPSKAVVQRCDILAHPLWYHVFHEAATVRTITRRGVSQTRASSWSALLMCWSFLCTRLRWHGALPLPKNGLRK